MLIPCPKCNVEFENYSKWGEKQFCSRKCANSRTWSDEVNNRRSNSAKTSHPFKQRSCEWCKKEYTYKIGHTKYCSVKCRKTAVSLKISTATKGRSGGIRDGAGRGKSGYYKGIYCSSTYELVWVIFNIDHDVEFKRFDGHIPYNNTKYFPDFIIGNKIVEIKGKDIYNTMPDKIIASQKAGYEIVVLYKENLVDCFEWVKSNYEYKALQALYDNHVPKYSLKCGCCKKQFTRENKPRTITVYCSKSCSMKHNRRNKNETKTEGTKIYGRIT